MRQDRNIPSENSGTSSRSVVKIPRMLFRVAGDLDPRVKKKRGSSIKSWVITWCTRETVNVSKL